MVAAPGAPRPAPPGWGGAAVRPGKLEQAAEAGFRFVPENARPRGLLWRWRAERACDSLLAPVLGSPAAFARELAHALHLARRGGAGFWLPQAHALRRFGRGLDLSVPAEAVASLMLDGVELGGRYVHTGRCFIGAGEWSPLLLSFARHQISREAQELKAAGLRFRDTRCYARYRRRAEQGKPMVRNRLVLDTPAAVDAYFEGFVALFGSIGMHGLQRRSTFEERAGWQAGRRRWLAELGEQDIGLALTADRRLVKLPGGQHRFAIARALGLAAVPVELRLLHVDAIRGMDAEALTALIDEGKLFQICNIDRAGAGRIILPSS